MAWDQEYLCGLWLSTHEAEYTRQLERFNGLESKAQGAATSCGVFLTAVFALASAETRHAAVSWILGLAAIFLALALTMAFLASYVQTFEDAPGGRGLIRMTKHLQAGEATPDADDFVAFHKELVERWQSAIHSLREVNHKKSSRLQAAQALLGVTGVVATIGIGVALLI